MNLQDATPTLCDRLDAAQTAIRIALTENDAERLPVLIQSREADLAVLSTQLGGTPELRGWAREYLMRDRELVARMIVARDAAAAKLGDLRKARDVHRAYASGGLF